MKMHIRFKMVACAALAMALVSPPADAGYNTTVTGTVTYVQQMTPGVYNFSPESVVFALSSQPTLSCGSGFNAFIFSPNSVADAQTRKNMLAILLQAKATGAQITVGYDSGSAPGNSCDQGYPIVYWLEIR